MTAPQAWNGTAFVEPTYKVWDGSTFVDPELYTWNGTGYDKVWPPNVPISIVGGNAGQGTSIAIPAHQVGDLILLACCNAGNLSNTTPTKPSASGTVPAWVDTVNNAGGSFISGLRLSRFVATATNHTSGTWTNSTVMAAVVLRGQNASPIGGVAESGNTGPTTSVPAITLTDSSGASAILQFCVSSAMNFPSAPPSGYTRLAISVTTASAGICVNYKNVTTSDGATTQSLSAANADNRGLQIEILD